MLIHVALIRWIVREASKDLLLSDSAVAVAHVHLYVYMWLFSIGALDFGAGGAKKHMFSGTCSTAASCRPPRHALRG
jgi:hypothetical protein